MKKTIRLIQGPAFLLLAFTSISCYRMPYYEAEETSSLAADSTAVTDSSDIDISGETGIASFTADEMHGQKTANGEIYNMRTLVAAHKTLPFGTQVEVTNLKNDKSVVVRINDRGPFVKGRIIDVSLEAAKRLDFVEEGTAQVRIKIIQANE